MVDVARAGDRVVGCSVVGGGGIDCGGVGIEDLHGVVAGSPEVRKVILHKVEVRSNGNIVQFHGGVQFVEVIILDGVLEHFSQAHNKVVRWWLELGGRLVG